MSDYNSSLPVRTETAGDVIAKIADATTPSQQLAVDGSGAITVKIEATNGDALTDTGGSLNVNVTNPISTGTADESAFTYGTSTQQPIGGVFQDTAPTVTAGTSAAVRINSQRGLHVNLRKSDGTEEADTNAHGLWVKPGDGTNSQAYTAAGEAKVDITSSTTLTVTDTNFPATVDTNYGTVGASTIRTAAQIGNATGAADFNAGATGAQTLRVTANQGTANATPWNENIAQISGASPSASNSLPVQISTGSAFVSSTNPLPVTIDTVVGTSINDYKDAAAIAAGSSDNHDYTVTAGKTLTLDSVSSSASGKAKMLVSIETGVATGVFTSRFVMFNSTAETNMFQLLTDPIQVAAGVRVRIVMSNRDNQAQDLYSTISGSEA